jgi:hypothetical protein
VKGTYKDIHARKWKVVTYYMDRPAKAFSKKQANSGSREKESFKRSLASFWFATLA